MCTLVILRREGAPWPLILGANRDEMAGRPWTPPGRHWPDRPNVVAGRDDTAGGSWLGINDEGLVAAVLNRAGTLGPEPGKRSRGELVLDALDHADATAAAAAVLDIEPRSYRPFNFFVADNRDAFWLAHRGVGPVVMARVPVGLSMLTARELNDPASPRIRRYRTRFAAAAPPDPATDDWAAWQALLADAAPGENEPPESAMRFRRADGFGTVSAALVALPAPGGKATPLGRFAAVGTAPEPWAPFEAPAIVHS